MSTISCLTAEIKELFSFNKLRIGPIADSYSSRRLLISFNIKADVSISLGVLSPIVSSNCTSMLAVIACLTSSD